MRRVHRLREARRRGGREPSRPEPRQHRLRRVLRTGISLDCSLQ
uniref:Uncharacterized protein n=1 Tax=Arundo donax TaxID=35708 RepID=A0A0A8YBP2_ARUDO